MIHFNAKKSFRTGCQIGNAFVLKTKLDELEELSSQWKSLP